MVREKDLLRRIAVSEGGWCWRAGADSTHRGHFVLPNTVLEKAEFEGYQIPKGVAVTFAVTKIGWDGVVWTKPMEFRPERFLERGGKRGRGRDGHNQGPRKVRMIAVQAEAEDFPTIGLALLKLEYFVANLVKEFE
ncbi:Cytochrome P450 89A2 [Ananas comosus]|uniref:Cytochrome P450 89A2 n=1 Tax=Ananas comosus TaxID=4615 RepID=A0A199VQE2_ANACO|nr:Cytochrome P450 89A2 [Ananas comosus]